MLSKKQYFFLWILLSSILIILFIFDVILGSVRLPFLDVLKIIFTGQTDHPEYATIIYKFRIPKALTALFAGFALSVSGLQMQTVFKNPLAGQYVLGISAGASLGVALLVMGLSTFTVVSKVGVLGKWTIVIASWMGSGLV